MQPSLEGPLARVRAAEHHIQMLDKGLGGFFNAHSHKVVIEKNTQTGQCEAILRDVHTVPDDFAIFAGMIAHNLRAALDGLACQLAILDVGGGTVANVCDKVMFPIFLRGPNSGASGRFNPKHGRIKPLGRFIAAVERLQPYKRGQGHRKSPLWLLHSLNNTDKHRLLVLFSVFSGNVQAAFPTLRELSAEGRGKCFQAPGMMMSAGGAYKDGAKVAEFDVTFPEDVKVKINVVPRVCFGKGCDAVKGLPVTKTLGQIRTHVRDIIQSFAPEFS